MASEFLQMVVVVELRNPSERLHGTVTGVEAGQSLTLSNVWSLDHRTWQPLVVVDPANIVEIFDASKNDALPPDPVLPASTTPVLSDPAILSFRPRAGQPSSGPRHSPSVQSPQPPTPTDSQVNIQQPAQIVPSVYIRRPSQRTFSAAVGSDEEGHDVAPTESSRTVVDGLETANTEESVMASVADGHIERQEERQKARRRHRPSRASRNGPPGAGTTIEVPQADRPRQQARGKGWRETPMLQSTSSFQPFNSLKKGSRQRQTNRDAGWASEDVTDVQEMGDFDFEGSLAKFNKRALFDKMRKEDQVNDADRLISHNRRPYAKPGTAGGKNLHYSENVLDLPTTSTPPKILAREPQTVSQDFWNSEADDRSDAGGERVSGREPGSRQSTRRSDSKAPAMRRSQSRKASAGIVGMAAGSSVPVKSHGLYLLPSDRRVEAVSALQMLNLENIAQNELGLTEDMMTENAGRGVAEVALAALADPAIKIRTGATDSRASSFSAGGSHVPPSTVVILAGNNKSGIRSVAAGRHLRNKGINVLVCIVSIERGERELLEDLRQQLRLYRNFGGRVYNKAELFEYLRKVTIPTLTIDTPRSAVTVKPPVVTLIVDALLGLAVSFDELRTGDQATVYELMEWANRNEAFVLAVDIPTGIDPTSGQVNIIDGSRLYVQPRYVVAMGAPKRGLVEALSAGESDDLASAKPVVLDDPALDWRLFVADIGLGAAVWKQASTKVRRGIDFDDKWVLEMKYRGVAADEEKV